MTNRSFITSGFVAAVTAVAFSGVTPAFAADTTRTAITPVLTLPSVPVVRETVVRHGMSARARAIFLQLAAENPGIESKSMPPAGTLVYSSKPVSVLPVRD